MERPKGMLARGIFLSLLLWLAAGLERGDRIGTMVQTLHDGFKTSWVDVPIGQMPRFREPSSSILRVPLPERKPPGQSGKAVNPSEDVKLSLTFADHKLILPWTVVFDAAKRKSLQKLTIIFAHDQFDVEGIDFRTEYGPRIARLDADHPSVTAFEVVYQWKGVDGEDFAMGIFLMFLIGIITLVLLTTFVCCFYEPVSKHSRSGPTSEKASVRHNTAATRSTANSSNSSSSSSSNGTPVKRHYSGYNTPQK